MRPRDKLQQEPPHYVVVLLDLVRSGLEVNGLREDVPFLFIELTCPKLYI
jgi:hypothetical protein